MSSITFCVVGYIFAFVLVRFSNASYEVFSVQRASHGAPFNFKYNWNDFLVMEITLKNIPPSVTAVYAIYSNKTYFFQNDLKATSRRKKVEAEIKNGEVKISIQRSIKEYNILVDVELQTTDVLCRTSRVAEGRFDSSNIYYLNENSNRYIYWNTDWNYDGTGSCLVPKPCEIVMDFKNRCQESLNCNIKGKKYICTLQSEKLDNLKSYLYQTYDTDESRTKGTFLKGYKYLAAVDSFYKLHRKTETWHDAKRICAQEGAILFYPENSEEAKAVISFWNPTPKDYLWVGISDTITEGEFVTVDGRPISEVHNIWRMSQPDNYDNEDCVHMYKDTQYNDIKCNVTWCSFICKRSRMQNIQLNPSSVIGAPLDSSAINTKLIFDSELFDNNTSVHLVKPKSEKLERSEKIILKAEDVVHQYIVREITYSETTEIEYSCEEYKNTARPKYLFVALINTTKEKIHTLKTEKNTRKFKMAHNGSILCCLYYVYESSSSGEELQITRFVVNKTLLIYKPEVPKKYPNPAVIQDLAQSTESNKYSWLLYLLPAFLGVAALTLTLYVLSKRRPWFKNSQPAEETVELDTQAQQNQVLYASLDFVGNRNQPQNQNEESYYAEIVGVLKPH